LTICPCCGFKFEGDMRSGCARCGACSVGEPLARPDYELPFYGRALVVATIGALALLILLAATVFAFFDRTPVTYGFWSLISAAQTAAWRLKWMALPFTLASIWVSWRMCAGMRRQPSRFVGGRVAHYGLSASVLFALLVATLIGVTVPERLRQRQRAIEATYRARLYTHNRAFMEYRARFGTFPADLEALRNLPDPDGSIAEVIAVAEQTSYKPYAELAATGPAQTKSRRLSGAALRNAAAVNSEADDAPNEGVPFTNYELRLPGVDKILGTEDDWLMRDGLVMSVVSIETPSTLSSNNASTP
jgi:hypothetical protein